jgi:Putative Ig domain
MASGIVITPPSLPNGTVETPYSEAIEVGGGCAPYKWTIASGALPAGVTAKASGTTTALDLTGKPTKAATYTFSVKATACGGSVSEKSYKVVIQAAANHVVDLGWKASTSGDIAGYNVYRGPNGTTWTRINADLVGSTVYDDSTVANGTTYYYAATAVDIEGRESVKTSAVKAVIP